MIFESHWNRAFAFWRRYEHHLGVGALAVGFLFDLFLADSPDSVVNNILLVSYLGIAGGVIMILNLRTRIQMDRENPAEPLLLLLMLQFCFGGLASNLLVLYGRSGTLTGSAIFVGLLGCLVLGNEYLRSRYGQMRFNIIVYYFLLLTYSVIAAPTFIFHGIGTGVFLMSGILSLIIIGAYLGLLSITLLQSARKQLSDIAVLIGIIFVIFNGLYFLNVIPPVPLSLKDIGVYHTILKYSSGDYLAMYEPSPWYQFWRSTSSTFLYTKGQSAYCFSSVYAPAELDTPIYHRWEYYDVSEKKWETVSYISFPISGGREDGYRGFSTTAALAPGEWRCNVETSSGSLIGRTSFTAVENKAVPTLEKVTL